METEKNSKAEYTEQMLKRATVLHKQGAISKAEALCNKILNTTPEHAWALNLLGIIQCQSDREEMGIKLIARALHAMPEEASFYNNFGTGLTRLGHHKDAIIAFKRALELKPSYAAAHNNIAAAFKALGNLREAKQHYQSAVYLRPTFAEAWANLANVLIDMGNIIEAETASRESIKLSPNYVAAQNSLGIVLHRRGLYSESEACFRYAIQLCYEYPDALCNLGELLKEQGRAEDAMAYYDEAWRLAPEEFDKGSNRLFAMCCLASLTPKNITKAHREWGKAFSRTPSKKHIHRDKNLDRRLRVGYVSADFRRHSVAYFLEPIFENHNKLAFETFAYANMAGDDEVTHRLKNYSDHWCDVFGMDDQTMVAKIIADKIDILVDLSGHTRGGRLPVFASKPAPIQITYLGYPATSGLKQIDYRITDSWADPPKLTEHFHTEKLLRLKNGFLCYRPPENAPKIMPAPSLNSGRVTFGSFNNLAKLTSNLIKTWAEILKSVPNSQLRLKSKALGDQVIRKRITQIFSDLGIREDRVTLVPWITNTSPLSAYEDIDIGLDTYPYHGTTTTMEALWMGVPVITLAGHWHASRVGISILARGKMSALIATNLSDYIDKAITLANSPDLLREYRQTLRDSLVRHGLTDGARFTNELENAYIWTWQNQ